MEVKGLMWVGTRTERFDETVAFAERVLGLGAPDGEPGMAFFELPDGSAFEVFAPGHPGGGHPAAPGPVAGFEVDDVLAAREELVAAGVEVSELGEGESWRWVYFRAPDGHAYEILGRIG
jgi:catechol 2,3-dioxygenase-like lactoylglutathione lyase family enzyme